MKRNILFSIGLILVHLSFSPALVLACSGGGPTPLVWLLEDISIVVKARVLDTDAYGQTGVVEIIDVLAGTSESNMLLVTQMKPVETTHFLEDRDGSGGCTTLAPPFQPDEEVYLFLVRNTDGSYRTSISPTLFSSSTMVYRFPEPDSKALLVTGQPGDMNTPSALEHQEVTEAEFRAVVLEHTQAMPITTPSTDTGFYPMPAPILVTTTSGASFVLPVDYALPVQVQTEDLSVLRRSNSVWRRGNQLGVTGCNTLGCTAYSPNGIDSASLTQDGVVLNGSPVPGEGFLFSMSNEVVAVWTEFALDFYMFHYPNLGFDQYVYVFTHLASHPLSQGDQWVAEAAWSKDGRLLAYSDATGLWLLDVYSQTSRLLVPVSPDGLVSTARYFSYAGRYLAITQGDERSTLDLITGAELPDGVFSPNERFLVAYDTSEESSEHLFCVVTSSYPCQNLGIGREAHWIDEERYIQTRCEGDGTHTCRVGVESVYCCSSPHFGEALTFDYEPVTATYLVVRSPHELEIFDGYHSVVQDLRAWTNEDIVNAEWLPALYSANRTFGDTVLKRYREWLDSLPPV